MSSTRQPPMGTPQLGTHAGLTPQMSIVDANGRPTMFFFRWLLTIGGAALTASDLSILESFDPGADAALTESAIADAFDAMTIAGGFDSRAEERAVLLGRIEELAIAGALRLSGPAPGPTADQRALEAIASAPATSEATSDEQRFLESLWAAPAPEAPATPIAFLADTLANWTLANYNPANYANGQQFFVTTWQVTYTVDGGLWTYSSGTYIAPAASRPATAFNGAALGVVDIGLQFLASDTDVYQYWNGAAWVVIAGGPAAVTTSFTPQLNFGGSAAGITYSTQYGSSTVVGKLVTVVINIILTSKGTATGTAEIAGLPIPPVANGVSAALYYNMAGLNSVLAQAASGGNIVFLYNTGTGNTSAFPANLTDANFTNSSVLQFTVSYPSP